MNRPVPQSLYGASEAEAMAFREKTGRARARDRGGIKPRTRADDAVVAALLKLLRRNQ